MGKKRKLITVLGTRPEVIKLAPIIDEANRSGIFDMVVLATAQHRGLMDDMLDVFGIKPDYDLDLMTEDQRLASITSRIITGVDEVIAKERPDCVIVQGDTVTTFGAALSAYYNRVKVAHVEAGLRTGDKYDPYPEEINRSLISRFSDFNFCPTEGAKGNLIREGVDKDTIYITGNTVIDALLWALKRPHNLLSEVIGNIDPGREKVILLTTHRRESFGAPMEGVFHAIKEVVRRNSDIRVIFPVHPNPNVRDTAQKIFGGDERVSLIDPPGYLDFVHLMKSSYLILTDSGGICEEAPSLKKPVLLFRDVTERPEALTARTAILVGRRPEDIIFWVEKLVSDRKEYERYISRENPFGDGKAAEKIIKVLSESL